MKNNWLLYLIFFSNVVFSQHSLLLDSNYIRTNKIKSLTASRVLDSYYYKNPPKEKTTEYYFNTNGQITEIVNFNTINGNKISQTYYTYNDKYQIITELNISLDKQQADTNLLESNIYNEQNKITEKQIRYKTSTKTILYYYAGDLKIKEEEYEKKNWLLNAKKELTCKRVYENGLLYKVEYFSNNKLLGTETRVYKNHLLDSFIITNSYQKNYTPIITKYYYNNKNKEIKNICKQDTITKTTINNYDVNDSLIEQFRYEQNKLVLHLTYQREKGKFISSINENNTGTFKINYNYNNNILVEATTNTFLNNDVNALQFNKDSLLSKIIYTKSSNSDIASKNYEYNNLKQLVKEELVWHFNESTEVISTTVYTYNQYGDTSLKKTYSNAYINNIKNNLVSDTMIYDFEKKTSCHIHPYICKTNSNNLTEYMSASQIRKIRKQLSRRKTQRWDKEFGPTGHNYVQFSRTIKNDTINGKGFIKLKLKVFYAYGRYMNYIPTNVFREIQYFDKKHYIINNYSKSKKLLYKAIINDTVITTQTIERNVVSRKNKDYLYTNITQYKNKLYEVSYYNSEKRIIKKKNYHSNIKHIKYAYTFSNNGYTIIETSDFGLGRSKFYTKKEYNKNNKLIRLITYSQDNRITTDKSYTIKNGISLEIDNTKLGNEIKMIYDYEFYK